MNKQKYEKHLYKGSALYEKGQFKAAIEEFRQAIRFNANDIGARLDIARCYTKLGALEQAKLSLKSIVPYVGGGTVSGAYYRLWSYIAIEEERYDVALACLKLTQRVNWTFNGFMEKRWLRYHCHYYEKVPWKDVVPLMKSYDIPVIFQIQW